MSEQNGQGSDHVKLKGLLDILRKVLSRIGHKSSEFKSEHSGLEIQIY